ncbi:MAG: hypothetical protein BWY74_01939 [Firmicutes bacterium ADurb.Bin419]|nr:MAG: hypothetical protein BWY74_01939 [Firmicutes bacterium ADurb.Bin419]
MANKVFEINGIDCECHVVGLINLTERVILVVDIKNPEEKEAYSYMIGKLYAGTEKTKFEGTILVTAEKIKSPQI